MRKLAFLAAVVFAFGLTAAAGCGPPQLSCSNPTKLTGYEGTLHFPPYVVQQDVWQQVGSQTMYVCDEASWEAIANQSGPLAVRAYPDSGKTYTDWSTCASQPKLSTFTTLSSTFAHVSPSSAVYDWAYDIDLNGAVCGRPTTEIMVWSQWTVTPPAAQRHPTIAGVAYDVFSSGTYIQVRRHTQVTSATVNLLAIFNYLEGQGLISATDTLQFVQYGAEILTSADQAFWLTAFSVSDS